MPLNESDHHRGLHLAVIDQESAAVLESRVFDTYVSSLGFEHFINEEYFPKFKDGSIVAVACKDDCSKNLTKRVKWFFNNMGAT